MDFQIPDVSSVLDAAISAGASAFGSGSPIDLAVKGVLAYLIAIWVAFVIWVVRDITNRSSNLIVQTFSILLVVAFTPIFGLPLYLLIRPRSTLFEKYYEEIGLAESEALEERFCEACHLAVRPEYRYCPHCRHELLSPCRNCGELVSKDWECCAFCWTQSPLAAEEPPKAKSKKGTKGSVAPKKERNPVDTAEKVVDIERGTDVPKAPNPPAPETTESERTESAVQEERKTVARILSLEEIPEAGK